MAPGTPAPSTMPMIILIADGASLAATPGTLTAVTYGSNFTNDVRTATFTPGNFKVSAYGSGYAFNFSSGCSGFTYSYGPVQTCTVTLIQTSQNCNFYNPFNVCATQTVPYQGPGPTLGVVYPNTPPSYSYQNPVYYPQNYPQTVYQPTAYAGAPALSATPLYLPNTGFAPLDSAELAFALVALIGAGLFIFPYVRKALAIALG